MRVYTTTFHFVHNYGAVLQAYALQQTLLDLGADTKIIDYRYYDEKLWIKVKIEISKKNIKNVLDNISTALHFCKCRTKFNRFENFINNQLKLTERFYTIEDLRRLRADAVVVGSDQVWNISANIHVPFTLAQIICNKKYSYAASMGDVTKRISTSAKEDLLTELNKFSGISVRESSAKDFLVREGVQKKVTVNVDPAFLLRKDQWELLIGKPLIEGKYIICYQLLRNDRINQVVTKLKENSGLSVFSICNSGINLIRNAYPIYDAGPLEFLNYIYYADKVVTTSFHGTAFSILFEKEFYCLNNSATPARIVELLQRVNLSDRLIDERMIFPTKAIDFSKSKKTVDTLRKDGIEYLRCILS